MKKFILIILLLSRLVVNSQSKKETIDWLNSKFDNSPFADNDIEIFTRFLKIKDDGTFTVQGYSYSIKTVLPNSENYSRKYIFKGHFKDLGLNSIRTEVIKGNLYIFASCRSGKCITQQNEGPYNTNSYLNNEVLLAITSNLSLEIRCKKAFIHLIKLCGGKSEAF
jgi:hypothetical protein